MTTEAELARANAISLEAKKDGLTQKQSGDWKLTLTIGAIDMYEQLALAPMGTRYQLVMVEITDDETPRNYRGEERERWHGISATRQAAIRCQEPLFWCFLEEEMHYAKVEDEEMAAKIVREICEVDSRAELDKVGNSLARQKWHQLDNAFGAWKVRENA